MLRWLQTLARPVDFGLAASEFEHQHLLRAMDVPDGHADAMADRLSVLMRPLIDQELSVVFYDLTTVTVHGEATCNDGDDADLRELGRAKDGIVARQFMLSLVQTADGLPIAHPVNPGATAEAGPLLPMIRQLLDRWPLKRVVLATDRGLHSLGSLAELQRLQAELDAAGHGVVIEHVLAVPTARYGRFRDEIAALDDAHDAAAPWVDETRRTTGTLGDPAAPSRRLRLVVAHDPLAAQRRTQARRTQIAELVALGERWGGRLDAQDASERRRGRPLSNSGAEARLYHAVEDANLAHLIAVDLHSDLFSFTVDEARLRYLERLDGELLSVTNTTTPAEEVVQRYKSLADIERGFRALTSEIEIAPTYHRLPRRIRAHAMVCFIALIVHRVLRMRLQAAGRAESPRRLLELLARVQHQAARTAGGQVVHGISELSPPQRDLFAASGAKPPTPEQIAGDAAV